MEVIFYLFLAVAGGILAMILAVAVVVFVVTFGGGIAILFSSFFRERKRDSVAHQAGATRWVEKPSSLPGH